MIKALLLVFEPVRTWDGIARAQRGILVILGLYVVPLLLLTSAVEGWGLNHYGKIQHNAFHPKIFSLRETVLFEAAQIGFSLLVVFVGAYVIKALGETFHGRHSYTQAFTTVAYGLGPLFAMRVLDALPRINPWLAWAIGIMLTISVLYQGVPRVMQPDPPHAFGLYLMSVILLLLITGVARFVTVWYLEGRFRPVENAIFAPATRLLF